MEAEFSVFETVGAVPLESNGEEADFVAKADPLFAFEPVDMPLGVEAEPSTVLEPKTPEADSES